MSHEDHQARAGRNQSLFREINEQLDALAKTFKFVANTPTFFCECARESCTGQMTMSIDEYQSLRQNGNRFAVLPSDDHVFPDVERVVERHENYWVLAKFGQGASIAKANDPRARSAVRG